MNLTRISKFLSLVLRHDPSAAGLTLDAEGWADVDALLQGLRTQGLPADRALLERVVAENEKRRFAFSADGTKIRANQGHSVSVDLGLAPAVPPEWLYHGTIAAFWPAIAREGLTPQQRQHVHLSVDVTTAERVGARRGLPFVLRVEAGRLHREGHVFYLAANGVWLTDAVPATALTPLTPLQPPRAHAAS